MYATKAVKMSTTVQQRNTILRVVRMRLLLQNRLIADDKQ